MLAVQNPLHEPILTTRSIVENLNANHDLISIQGVELASSSSTILHGKTPLPRVK